MLMQRVKHYLTDIKELEIMFLIIYLALSIVTIFTIQAAVTIVTAGLCNRTIWNNF